MSATEAPILDVFQQFSRLYKLRNRQGGQLDPAAQEEWNEVTFTLDSIFSGLYRPDARAKEAPNPTSPLRTTLPVEYLRVPTDADVLCETPDSFFSGKLQDISTGGAYVHAPIRFRLDAPLRLTFCTFRDVEPLELEARIAWNNPGSIRKQNLPEGAGVEFTNCTLHTRGQIQDFVYELVEETLTRANLL